MTIYEVLNTFIRNNKVNATARFFKSREDACFYFSVGVEALHIRYKEIIETGDFDELETSNNYLLYDTNNPDDFTERFSIITHQV